MNLRAYPPPSTRRERAILTPRAESDADARIESIVRGEIITVQLAMPALREPQRPRAAAC